MFVNLQISNALYSLKAGNQNWYDNVENLSNAALHRIIVENKFQLPINEKNILSYGVNESDIHKIYNWPFLTTKNSKLIMLQFKINHNIIYTKDKLKKVNLIPNDVCHLCEREKHTIKHMMLKCTYVTLFWNEFFAWWAQITNEQIHLPDSVLLYGPVNLSKHNQELSLALLVDMMLKCTYVTLFWNEFFAWWAQITNEQIHLPDSVLLYGPVNLSFANTIKS